MSISKKFNLSFIFTLLNKLKKTYTISINILSQFNVGVQLGTASAGTFNLNCSFHGIPCIGYSNVNTQKILHPLTTVDVGEIDRAKEIANKLKDDEFYKLCMETTQKRYELYYSEEKFLKHMRRIFSTWE